MTPDTRIHSLSFAPTNDRQVALALVDVLAAKHLTVQRRDEPNGYGRRSYEVYLHLNPAVQTGRVVPNFRVTRLLRESGTDFFGDPKYRLSDDYRIEGNGLSDETITQTRLLLAERYARSLRGRLAAWLVPTALSDLETLY